MAKTSSTSKQASGDLTPKQRLFAHEYLVDRNGTQAAIRAGYAAGSADVTASRLLGNARIAALVNARMERIEEHLTEKTETSLERIILELRRILLADPLAAFDDETGAPKKLSEIPQDLRRAISGLEVLAHFDGAGEERYQDGEVVKLKFWSKTEASSQLLRVLGAFKDRLEVVEKPYSELVAEAARRMREERAP